MGEVVEPVIVQCFLDWRVILKMQRKNLRGVPTTAYSESILERSHCIANGCK